jgi:hypothetical protein
VLAATALGAVVAGLCAPTAAQAAAPTRIKDRTIEVSCSAVGTGGEEINFYVASSDLSGTFGAVQASTADGENLGRGEGSSDWTASSFRASVPVYDLDDSEIGSAYLSGSYRVESGGERFTSKFKDGNIRVVEDHTYTPVTVRDVTLTFPGVTMVDTTCDATQTNGSLFFTNPTAHVGRDGGLVSEDCTLVNAEAFFFEGTIDALGVGLVYADAPDYSAFSPSMDLSGGSWTGTFNAANDDGPIAVDAQVRMEQAGEPVKLGDSGKWGSERFVITPYELVVRVDGPGAPAEVTCSMVDVDHRFRTMRR